MEPAKTRPKSSSKPNSINPSEYIRTYNCLQCGHLRMTKKYERAKEHSFQIFHSWRSEVSNYTYYCPKCKCDSYFRKSEINPINRAEIIRYRPGTYSLSDDLVIRSPYFYCSKCLGMTKISSKSGKKFRSQVDHCGARPAVVFSFCPQCKLSQNFNQISQEQYGDWADPRRGIAYRPSQLATSGRAERAGIIPDEVPVGSFGHFANSLPEYHPLFKEPSTMATPGITAPAIAPPTETTMPRSVIGDICW